MENVQRDGVQDVGEHEGNIDLGKMADRVESEFVSTVRRATGERQM